MFDLAGKTIGQYRIVEQIGVGGMATVYKAYQPNMDRYVAIKVLPIQLSKDPEFAKRFQREARAIARLEHSHILPVYDYGEHEGITYIAMRYVKAGTLKDRMSTGQLSLEEINRLIGQIGGALDYAHRVGVIHRDVKPANVLIDDQGDTYLSDFGLARMMEPSQQLTGSGVGIGTPAYMSPEQGQGIKVDHRSDIYSLGVILYEMLAGRVPYEAETPMAVVFKHITGDLPLPRTINPNIPESVERVILKALAKDPTDRYQTVGEMVQALHAAVRMTSVEEQQEAIPDKVVPARQDISVVTRLQRLWNQPRGKIILASGAIAVVLFVGFLLLQLPGNITILAPHANQENKSSASLETQAAPGLPTPIIMENLTTDLPSIAAGTVLFEEDFEDNNIQGIGFSADSDWKIVTDETGNKVYEIDNRNESDYRGFSFGMDEWEDYSVEYRARFLDSTDSQSEHGLQVRSDGNSYYVLVFSEIELYLAYSIDKSEWKRVIAQNPKIESDVWYKVRVDVQGEQVSVYLNDALLINAKGSRISQGWVMIFGGSGTHAQVDDIRVTALGDGANMAQSPMTPTTDPGSSTQSTIALYDDFNNPTYEESINPVLWQDSYNVTSHFQKDGILVITQTGRPKQGTGLFARRYSDFVIDSPMAFEAQLMLDPEKHPNSSQESGSLAISLDAQTPSNETWVAKCELTGDDAEKAGIWCLDWWNDYGEQGSKVMEQGRVSYGSWHTFRIEIDPTDMTVTYFINGELVDSFTPVNADKLRNARFILSVNVWTNSADTITGYVDNVRAGEIPLSTSTTITAPVTTTPEPQLGELVYEENFEDGFSHGFSFYSGNWRVVDDGTGNKVLENDSGYSGSNARVGSFTFSDGVIEFRCKVVSGNNPIVALSFRLNSASDYIDYKVVYDEGGVNLNYQDKNGWQPVEASSGGGAVKAIMGDWITLRVEAQGENMKVFVNGDLIINAIDSRLKTGEINIGTFPNMVTQFDDFKVWELSR